MRPDSRPLFGFSVNNFSNSAGELVNTLALHSSRLERIGYKMRLPSSEHAATSLSRVNGIFCEAPIGTGASEQVS